MTDVSTNADNHEPSIDSFNGVVLSQDRYRYGRRVLLVDQQQLTAAFAAIELGIVPVGLFNPPPRIRVLISSTPSPANIYVRGVKLQFSTPADLYIFADDMRQTTVELAGYAPCAVEQSLVPGKLRLPDGRETMHAKCDLLALDRSRPRNPR